MNNSTGSSADPRQIELPLDDIDDQEFPGRVPLNYGKRVKNAKTLRSIAARIHESPPAD